MYSLSPSLLCLLPSSPLCLFVGCLGSQCTYMDNSLDYFSGLQPIRCCFCTEFVAVHVCIYTCMCVKKWKKRSHYAWGLPVRVCAIRLFPLWVAAWTFPEGWCPARLTSEQPGWLGGPQKKAPRGYEYKLSCWTSSDFTMAPPEPLSQTHEPKESKGARIGDALFWQHKRIWTALPADRSSNP